MLKLARRLVGPSLLASLAFVAAAYAATLTTSISTNITAVYRGSNDFGAPVQELSRSLQPAIQLATGVGSGQADLLFSDTRTLAASATENLDIRGGLTDAFGNTLNFVTLKVIKICAAAANTNNVVVGGASNPVTSLFAATNDKINVRPGGCFIWVAPQSGLAAAAGSTDELLVANSSSGTGVTYDVILIGTSS